MEVELPHHFQKNVIEASVWCKICGKDTPHRVDDRRRGPCKVCMAKTDDKPKVDPKDKYRQGEMFPDSTTWEG